MANEPDLDFEQSKEIVFLLINTPKGTNSDTQLHKIFWQGFTHFDKQLLILKDKS